MKIQQVNYYQNYKNSAPKQPQSFGAIRGDFELKHPNKCFKFDEVLSYIMKDICRIYGDDAPTMLSDLAKQQAELAKTGDDFTSKIERMVIQKPTGEVIHPILGLMKDPDGLTLNYYNTCLSIKGKNYPSRQSGYYDQTYRNMPPDKILPKFLDDLFKQFQKFVSDSDEAMEAPLGQVQSVLRMLPPPPPPKPLEEVVLPDFSNLSGIPEDQAKLLIPQLIKELTKSGKPATERDLLEIAQQTGSLPPLSTKEETAIKAEVEKLLPKQPDEEIKDLLELKAQVAS